MLYDLQHAHKTQGIYTVGQVCAFIPNVRSCERYGEKGEKLTDLTDLPSGQGWTTLGNVYRQYLYVARLCVLDKRLTLTHSAMVRPPDRF